ncbi:MAG: penicillin-binding transpeptidase domain-containing protein [Planctomycetota bacterium]
MVRKRIRWLMVFATLPYVAILARLSALQLVRETRDRYILLSLHRRPRLTPPARGRILAAGGEPLAENAPVYNLEFTYGELNPRAKAIALVSRALRRDPVDPGEESPTEVDPFADPNAVERELLRIAGAPRALPWLLDGPEDETEALWLPFVERIPSRAAEQLLGPLSRHADSLRLEPSEDGRSSRLLVRPAGALRMEIALFALARRLASDPAASAPGGPPPREAWETFEALRAKVSETLARIERLVEREVAKLRAKGADDAACERKRRAALAAYHDGVSWPLLAGVPPAAVTEVEYHPERYPGIDVVAATRRVYPAGEAAAALVGQTRRLTDEEIAARRDRAGEDPGDPEELVFLDLIGEDDLLDTERFLARRETGIRRGDPVGDSGLERYYDRELRGRYGRAVVTVDRRGRPRVLLDEVLPSRGEDLRTTLDLPLQKALFDALARRVREGVGKAASAAVLEVESGAVLASACFPSFDPHRPLTEEYGKELEAAFGLRDAFLDRPARIPLFPGSTFKLVLAVAAMEAARPWEGEFSPQRRYPCDGSFPLEPKERCDGQHGEVDLAEAIGCSCNVYFYYLGCQHLGAEAIRDWALAFGYGIPTGIDLGPRARTRRGLSSRLDGPELVLSRRSLCDYAIGQVHVEATPLQVLRSVAALASGCRELPRPHLIAAEVRGDAFGFRDPATGDLRKEIRVRPETLEVVREGLWRVGHAPRGTAHKAEHGLSGFAAALKTGTAEIAADGGKLNAAWLVGYAPFHAPRIAFVVAFERVPEGIHGAEACAPVVRELLGHFAAEDPEAYLAGGEG